MAPFLTVWTEPTLGEAWWQRHQGQCPLFACVLGFTATGLLPGISAAGATPGDRATTALADGEFLLLGPQPHPRYPLPPLHAGVSPALITRALCQDLPVPIRLFNAGLPQVPPFPAEDLGGQPARCLSSGQAMDLALVENLLLQGWRWGERLARGVERPGYLVVGECVVGGTTTALALLLGLGFAATGKVNSSHSVCNHGQKSQLVAQGLAHLAQRYPGPPWPPLPLVAAVGDPMQVVVAGMAIAASCHGGVLLAGGTQMLAVYALARAIVADRGWDWNPRAIALGTTRWVVEDPTGDTVGLAQMVGDVPLLSTSLNFSPSIYPQLRMYEQGFVKEGVGAGGSAIAASLYRGWGNTAILASVEQLLGTMLQLRST